MSKFALLLPIYMGLMITIMMINLPASYIYIYGVDDDDDNNFLLLHIDMWSVVMMMMVDIVVDNVHENPFCLQWPQNQHRFSLASHIH